MTDGAVDYEARGDARNVRQLIESHERIDEERFTQVRDEVKAVKESQEALSTKFDDLAKSLGIKMEDVKELIGSRPTWTVSMIITGLVGVIGFLTARVWPA